MQDAGIMLGRHLKAAPAFIYWDGSSVRRKEKRSARVAPSLFMVSSKAHSSTTPSFSVFGIKVLCLFWQPRFALSIVEVWRPSGGLGVTGRVDRSTWRETTTVISHFSTCCSQVQASGTHWRVSSFFGVNLLRKLSSETRQGHGMSPPVALQIMYLFSKAEKK